MAVLTRCTIQCSKYFISLPLFEAPKVSLTSRFCVFTTSAYTRRLFSAYGHSKCVAVSPFSLSQTFFLFFCFLLAGGGWVEKAISINLGYKRDHPLEKKRMVRNQKFVLIYKSH